MRSASLMSVAGAVTVLLFFANAVFAQVPPTPHQISGFSPLHLAAHKGDVVAIRKLAASGSDINVRDSYGRTALMVASFARKPGAIAALIDAGAKTGLLENDRYDALTIAAVANFPDIVRLLIKKGASAKLVTSVYDGTALIAAAHLGHAEVVRELVRGGAPLDHVNNLGWTALIEAIVLGRGGPRHVATVKILVEAGANVNLPDGDGASPLQLTKARKYSAIIKILQAAGAK